MRKRIAITPFPTADCTQCCYMMTLMGLSGKNNYKDISELNSSYKEKMTHERDPFAQIFIKKEFNLKLIPISINNNHLFNLEHIPSCVSHLNTNTDKVLIVLWNDKNKAHHCIGYDYDNGKKNLLFPVEVEQSTKTVLLDMVLTEQCLEKIVKNYQAFSMYCVNKHLMNYKNP